VIQNIDIKALKELVTARIREFGANSLRSYILKTLGLPKTRYDYYT